MKIESDFWKRMKKMFLADWLERHENKVGSGTPDVHFMHRKNPGWIELKFEEKFPSRIDFQPGQPLWLYEYAKKGGRCFVFLYVKAEKSVYVWHGRDAIALNLPGGAKETKPFMVFDDERDSWEAVLDVVAA